MIASAIYGFMILGFLGLENALLYNGTLFAFGWPDTMFNRIVIYGLLDHCLDSSDDVRDQCGA